MKNFPTKIVGKMNFDTDSVRTFASSLAELGYFTLKIERITHENWHAIFADGFAISDKNMVSWSRSVRGLAKTCRDKACQFWKNYLYPRVERASRLTQKLDVKNLAIDSFIAPEFEEDGFEVFIEDGVINTLSWLHAEQGSVAEKLCYKLQ